MSIQGQFIAGHHPEIVGGESCVFAITQPDFINTLPMGNTIPAAQQQTSPAPAEPWLHLLLLSRCLPANSCMQKGDVQHTPFISKGDDLWNCSYTGFLFCV